MCLGNMSLKRKSVFTFLDDLETTFTLQFLDKIEKFPFTAFFIFSDFFPKYTKAIRTPFFVYVRF